MIQKPKALRIVSSWPGIATGETVYKTEDGRIWNEDYEPTAEETTSITTKGTVYNGFIMTP